MNYSTYRNMKLRSIFHMEYLLYVDFKLLILDLDDSCAVSSCRKLIYQNRFMTDEMHVFLVPLCNHHSRYDSNELMSIKSCRTIRKVILLSELEILEEVVGNK